jgi:hypothetical protein
MTLLLQQLPLLSISYQTAKLQLKHLANTLKIQDHHKIGLGLPSIPHTTGQTEFYRNGCQGIRVLLEMKRQISWHERDLNILSQDLNQLVASQLKLPKKAVRDWTNRNHKKKTGNP